MTSISSLSSYASTSLYSSSLDKNGDGVISADELAAASTTGKKTQDASLSSQETGSDSDAASKFASLVMSLIFQMTGDESAQSDDGNPPPPPSVTDLDTDGDGSVSDAEFAAAKPDDVTDDMSASLFSSLDEDANGSLDEAELQAMRNAPPPPPLSSDQEVAETDDTEISLDDFLEQLQLFVQQYFADSSDTSDTASVAAIV